jgi:PAS domain S-box-containing protein
VEVVNSADVAIISTTLDGIVQSWNPSAERLFGYRADEILGKSAAILAPWDQLGEEDEILRRLRQCERVEHCEAVRRRKDGSHVPVSLTISPVKDEAGNIIGASKIARDISDRKKAEAAIRESAAPTG